MPWGFMDWVRGRPFRPDPEELTLPENASPAELRAMALRLLEDKHAYKACELLREQPDAARPVLEDLVRNDARFRSLTDVRKSWMQSIYEVALKILSEWDSPYAIEQALELAGTSDAALRAVAARLLAARGEGRFTPALVKLAGDADPAVREAVADGLSDVIEYGEMRGRTLDDRLSRAMYDLMLACVLRTDHGAGVCFPPVLLQLDRARAAKALASDEALTIDRNWLRWTLVALRDAGVVVGADKLRALLRDARAVLERADTPQSDRPGLGMLISELVLSIAQHDRDEAMTLASSLADSPHDAAREAAQNVREHLAEVDPVQRVIAEREAVGEIALMRPEHRNVYLVWLLDAEVQNGGWLQWVANSSGQHAPQTLEALRALGLDAAAGQLETMMAALGPRGWSDDQAERMAAIDRALSAAKTLPSDGDLWDMGTQIRAAISDYAERHREAFAADD